MITLRLTTEERDLIKIRAAKEGLSMNSYIRQTLGLPGRPR